MTKVESIRTFANNVLDKYGSIDVLVCNAGYNSPKPELEYTEEGFDYVSDVNLKGAFFVATLVAQSMIERNIKGSIITISSQVGIVGGRKGHGRAIDALVGRSVGYQQDHGRPAFPSTSWRGRAVRIAVRTFW